MPLHLSPYFCKEVVPPFYYGGTHGFLNLIRPNKSLPDSPGHPPVSPWGASTPLSNLRLLTASGLTLVCRGQEGRCDIVEKRSLSWLFRLWSLVCCRKTGCTVSVSPALGGLASGGVSQRLECRRAGPLEASARDHRETLGSDCSAVG